jgi:hypothetical protein
MQMSEVNGLDVIHFLCNFVFNLRIAVKRERLQSSVNTQFSNK